MEKVSVEGETEKVKEGGAVRVSVTLIPQLVCQVSTV